jgi:hypothetical protein
MKNLKTTEEVDIAFNVLLKTLDVDYADLEPETITHLTNAISASTKVKNSALLYLTCSSNRAGVMRERLVRDVMELYERGF